GPSRGRSTERRCAWRQRIADHLTKSTSTLDILKQLCDRGKRPKGERHGRSGHDVRDHRQGHQEPRGVLQAAFDWKLGSPQPAYTMIYPAENEKVLGVLTPVRPGTPTHAMFYVQVTDIDAALAKIERL